MNSVFWGALLRKDMTTLVNVVRKFESELLHQRTKLLRSLPVPSNPHTPTEENRPWRHCYEAILRSTTKERIRIKRSWEQSTAEWLGQGGGRRWRLLAKEFDLLRLAGESLMPYETECEENLRIGFRYDGGSRDRWVGAGNVLLPEHCVKAPRVILEAKGEPRDLLCIDIDAKMTLWAM